MAFAAPGLKRQLFGYRKSAVHQVLADREHMFSRAVEDAKEARSRLAEANERLGALRGDLEERSAVAEAAVARSTELEAAIATLQQRIADQVELTREAESRVAVAEMELKTSRDAVHVLEARTDRAEERARQLEHDLDAARGLTSTLYGEIADLRQRHDARGSAVVHANEAAEAARAEASRLREETDQLRNELARMEAELEAATSAASPAAPTPPVVTEQRSPSEEIAQAITAADEAVSRIFESGRRRVSDELEQAERRRDEVQREIARLEARHEEMEHTMAEVRASLGDARQRITTVEEHLHQALDPLTLSLLTLGDRLARLDEATVPSTPDDPAPAVSPSADSQEEGSEAERDARPSADRHPEDREPDREPPDRFPPGGTTGSPGW